jgi:hypothetical protein
MQCCTAVFLSGYQDDRSFATSKKAVVTDSHGISWYMVCALKHADGVDTALQELPSDM